MPFQPVDNMRSAAHVPWTDDFCLDCGADLRIARRRVDDESDVPQAAKNLLAIAVAAERMERAFLGDGYFLKERLHMHLLQITPEQQKELAGIYCEGLEAEIDSRMCGLDETELAGIGADGTFLYVPRSKPNPMVQVFATGVG
jgi:hypothetical protein